MEPLVRNEPGELDSLVMENELLRYEVAHLRARLAAEQAARPTATETEQPRGGAPAPAARRDDAREDLVWLLERLDRSPAGRLLRSREGFRTLRAKYLDGPTGD